MSGQLPEGKPCTEPQLVGLYTIHILLQDRVIPPSVGLLGKISRPACSETLATVHRVQLYRGRKTDVDIKAAFQPAVFLSSNGFSAILHFLTSVPAPPHCPVALRTSDFGRLLQNLTPSPMAWGKQTFFFKWIYFSLHINLSLLLSTLI